MVGEARRSARPILGEARGFVCLCLAVAFAVIGGAAAAVRGRPAETTVVADAATVIGRGATLGGYAATGTVEGTVYFRGTVPDARRMAMDADPYCRDLHDGQPAVIQPVVVGDDARLADVVVYVKGAATPGSHAQPGEPVILDQRRCAYSPRVLVVRAGQPIIIRNSDDTLHNINVQPSQESNEAFNIAEPFAGIEVRRQFVAPEVGIPVHCDVHPWMSGSIHVFDHPFVAVSAADGSFALEGLPSGDLVIEAWHQTLGVIARTVSLGDGENLAIELTFDATAGSGPS